MQNRISTRPDPSVGQQLHCRFNILVLRAIRRRDIVNRLPLVPNHSIPSGFTSVTNLDVTPPTASQQNIDTTTNVAADQVAEDNDVGRTKQFKSVVLVELNRVIAN